MKRWLVVGCLVMLALLCGCARAETAWETVDDEIWRPVSAEAPLVMVFDVPEQAELLGTAQGWRAYAHPDGDYRIVAQTVAAGSMEEAVQKIEGIPAEALRGRIREGERRCSLGWYAVEEDGGYLYRTEILAGEDHYYALTFSVREEDGTTYDSTEEQTFASFGLISDETVREK